MRMDDLKRQPEGVLRRSVGSPLLNCVPGQFELVPLRVAAGGREDLTDLPAYVVREFDDELRTRIVRVAEGSSKMVTLVSDFAAGKKRALWESLWQSVERTGELLLRDWTVWPAASPSSPEALINAAETALPKTVFFLPSLDRYLGGHDRELGDAVARVLRETLSDPRRGPILILGTIRNDPLRELRANSTRFPHAKLLIEGSEIRVADEFSFREMRSALASEDPRVVEAATRADDDRYVIQHMLDVYDIDDRMENAGFLERAIFEFAIAARRFGHDRTLARDLLINGAGAYLKQKVQHVVDEASIDATFAELTRRGPGGASVMTETDSAIVDDTVIMHYRLDDYIERRYVASITDSVMPEPQLMPVLVDTANDASLVPLARQCRKHCLLYWAMRFYLRAAEGGDRAARLELAEMLRLADRIDDALDQYRRLVDGGDQQAIILGAEMLIAAGRNSDAVDLLGDSDRQGRQEAKLMTARALEGMKRRGDALRLYRELAEQGHFGAAAVAADIMIDQAEGSRRTAARDEAVEWLMRLADRCGFEAVELATELLVDNQQVDAAVRRLDVYAMTGKRYAWLLGARILFTQGRAEEALEWCQAAVEYGVPQAATFAAKINAQLGLAEVAMGHAWKAVAKGSPEALTEVGNVHAENGLTGRALECYRSAFGAGDRHALARATLVAAAAGWSGEAAEFYRQACRARCEPPVVEVAAALCRASQPGEAFAWYFKVVPDVANADIIVPLIDFFLTRQGGLTLRWDIAELAISGYVNAVKVARKNAISWLAEGFIRAGEQEDRAAADQYGGRMYAPPVSRKFLAAADLLNRAAVDGDYEARVKLVAVLCRIGRFTEAHRHLDTIKRKTTTNVDVEMTVALAGQGRLDDAAAGLWAQLKKANAVAVAPVANSLLKYDHEDAAVAFLEQGVELGDINSHILLGDHKLIKRRYVDALDLYLFALLHVHADAEKRIDVLFTLTKDHNTQRDLRRYGVNLAAQIAEPWSVSVDSQSL
ncbi:tetratricopeptide repeat protein [Amycolatopsis alba]|uniref:tetratricopeptide repeat protein n=1 Tax=Amycolatopsis alba TaxID=76020 RepID=UPI0003A96E2F|nr:hypothetical protein [Amycolatopsis alba]